ncbi:MAG: hypothetical protein ABEJ95_01530 [Candidatus Nanohalobium sp.]
MSKSRLERYGLILIGIMVAVGFSGMFTYSSIVDTGDSDNQGTQEINATLPESNYSNESFGLSVQEQAYLAVNNDIVFVNALYENTTDRFQNLTELPSEFNDRVYVNLVNNSETYMASDYRLELPSTLIIGGKQSQTQRGTLPYTLKSAGTDSEDIREGICSAMRDLGDLAATCYTG